MNYRTLNVRFQDQICFLRFHRPEADNTINEQLVGECHEVLALCDESITVVVLEGLPEVFCLGADFQGIHRALASGNHSQQNAEPLYDLWLKLATGPYISIAHVRGKANAGGVGFVAACDIVVADRSARFSLSELLFGIYPACVFPFLIRRIGFQKAHYLTLMTQPIDVERAQAWGLVDAYDVQSESLLRKHLIRLRNLSKTGISNYKRYVNGLSDVLFQSRSSALQANRELFSDPRILDGISRYVEEGRFPWED